MEMDDSQQITGTFVTLADIGLGGQWRSQNLFLTGATSNKNRKWEVVKKGPFSKKDYFS